MNRADISTCRTREVTLGEFMEKYMNPRPDERYMGWLMSGLRGEKPLLGYLTFYGMDNRPTLEAVFLYPDRLVTAYNYMLAEWGYEPYPNPNSKTIPIDQHSKCQLEPRDELVEVSFTGPFMGIMIDYKTGDTRLANGPEAETFVQAFNRVRDLQAGIAEGSGPVDWARLVFERSYDFSESVRNFNEPWRTR